MLKPDVPFMRCRRSRVDLLVPPQNTMNRALMQFGHTQVVESSSNLAGSPVVLIPHCQNGLFELLGRARRRPGGPAGGLPQALLAAFLILSSPPVHHRPLHVKCPGDR